MQPPYSGLKIIHEQQIQDALEYHRLYSGQETRRRSLLQSFGKVLARFTTPSDRKQERPLPGCARIEVVPCTTLEDLQTLVPPEDATLEECGTVHR